MFRNADPKEHYSASEAGSRVQVTGQVREGVELDLSWLHAQPCPNHRPQVRHTVLPGSQRMHVRRKGPHCQLGKVMEMLCRRARSHVRDSPTSVHHTHSSINFATKNLWAPQEPKNQHEYDLTKAICVEHWSQASGLHASAWVAEDQAEMASIHGASTKGLSPFMSVSPTWQDLGPYTDTLGFCGLSASSFSL